ncbi:MAG: hypothetical protein R2817_14285 [Flavobacteriales bacterium]
MSILRHLVFALLLPAPALLPAQAPTHAGELFLYWGYNRALFGRSDIHLEGPAYSITLHDVQAADRPHPFAWDTYFNPRYLWFPQYVYRLGWHFREEWSVSLGLDHMKYVVRPDQAVAWNGELKPGWERSVEDLMVLDSATLTYEHTDGLNLLSVDLDRYHRLWAAPTGTADLRLFTGVHAGPVICRSDVRLFGEGLNNRFNVAGFGVGAQAGLHFTFARHFFVRNMLRTGWIDLTHVLTTGRAEDSASQHFGFLEHAIMAGGAFRIGGRGK